MVGKAESLDQFYLDSLGTYLGTLHSKKKGMDGPRQLSLAARLPRLLRETMARAPWAALRLIDIAFSPRQHIRMLALVSAIQLLAAVSRRLRRWYRLTLPHNAGLRIQERARTQEEWIAADNIQAAAEDSRRVSATLGAGDDAQAFHFCFAHPPISPICRTPLFQYLKF